MIVMGVFLKKRAQTGFISHLLHFPFSWILEFVPCILAIRLGDMLKVKMKIISEEILEET